MTWPLSAQPMDSLRVFSIVFGYKLPLKTPTNVMRISIWSKVLLTSKAMTHYKIHCYFTFPFYLFLFFFPFVQMYPVVHSQLDIRFYDRSCPFLPMIVRRFVTEAVRDDTRMAASLLRLHFHDCIVDVTMFFLKTFSISNFQHPHAYPFSKNF